VLVSGTGHKRMASFQQLLTQEQGETVIALVQRAAVIGMAHIDPYITALSEVQSHADDRDFADAETVIRFALASLPPTPVNFERSLFENLNGIIALFRGDAKLADEWFEPSPTCSSTSTRWRSTASRLCCSTIHRRTRSCSPPPI
jgi:hypothetical protein